MFNKNTKNNPKPEPPKETIQIPRGNYILSVEVGPNAQEKKLVINAAIEIMPIPGEGLTVDLGVSRSEDTNEVRENGHQ